MQRDAHLVKNSLPVSSGDLNLTVDLEINTRYCHFFSYLSVWRAKRPDRVLQRPLLPPHGLSRERSPSRMWRCAIVTACLSCSGTCPSPSCPRRPSASWAARGQVRAALCVPEAAVFSKPLLFFLFFYYSAFFFSFLIFCVLLQESPLWV